MNADDRGFSRSGDRFEVAALRFGSVTEPILGAFYDVYNELGFGFLESVYQQALGLALAARGVSYRREVGLSVYYREQRVGTFRADFLVRGVVIVEIKAVRAFDAAHRAQLLNYLRATDTEVGLLLNFGPPAEFARMIFDRSRKIRGNR
jgi:GxxExxY protein